MRKELMERMSEHTGLISSYQLLITAACTNTGGKMKGSHSRAADRCPFVPRHSLNQVTSFMHLGMLCMIRHHCTYPWLSIIMDIHNRSQQNTWKLFDTLSVLMSYRKYYTISLEKYSNAYQKLRLVGFLRCDTINNGVKKFIDQSLIKEYS